MSKPITDCCQPWKAIRMLLVIMASLSVSANTLATTCNTEFDCGYGGWHCNLNTNTCFQAPPGQCFSDPDCEDWEVCDLSVCTIANTCSTNTDCDGLGNVSCDEAIGACRFIPSCTVDGQCALGELCVSGQCATDVSADFDRDGVPDVHDNCPAVVNTGQEDSDSDGLGDRCDADLDGDGHANATDNCPYVKNNSQTDRDEDGIGDSCEADGDNDGVPDDIDNCPNDSNPGQGDLDGDGLGDNCDFNIDGDYFNNPQDSCERDARNGYPADFAPDLDGNGVADVCEDADQDTVTDVLDNCIWDAADGVVAGSRYHNGTIENDPPNTASPVTPLQGRCQNSTTGGEVYCYDLRNPSQANLDRDRFGDHCDTDLDGDGITNDLDNCVYAYNPSQEKWSQSALKGDACEFDWDSDGVRNEVDNCPRTSGGNASQTNTDGDPFGDVCDLCPNQHSASNLDTDNDGRGDACDSDMDGDGWLNNDDNCPGLANADQADSNQDGIGNVCQ